MEQNISFLQLYIIQDEKTEKNTSSSIKKLRRKKYKKVLRNHKEIKAYEIPSKLRIDILKIINNLDIVAYSIVVDKNVHQTKEFLKINSDKDIYLDVVSQLLSNIPISGNFKMRMDKFISRRYINSFNRSLIKNLNKKFEKSEIIHSDSHKWIGIQLSDVIANSVFQLFENKNCDYVTNLDKIIIFKYKFQNKKLTKIRAL